MELIDFMIYDEEDGKLLDTVMGYSYEDAYKAYWGDLLDNANPPYEIYMLADGDEFGYYDSELDL